MKKYTIQEVTKLAKVSARTLRYYQEIGLLMPEVILGNRIYSEQDLLKLQQILIYKELALPLERIKEILNDENFNILTILETHSANIDKEISRLQQIKLTIHKTMNKIKDKNSKVTEAELYEGLSRDEIDKMENEVKDRYDPAVVEESFNKVKNYSKSEFEKIKEEGGKILSEIANLKDKGYKPEDKEVQEHIGQYYQYLNNFYTPTLEIYKGLGEMYVQDERFTKFFEKISQGLAKFVSTGIREFVSKAK